MFQFPGFAFVTLLIQAQIPSSDICKSKTKIPFHLPASSHACAALNFASHARASGFKFTDIEGGFPHSEILGSKLVRSSPRLIAAYHVLHRLLAPRHPPDTLIALDCSHYRCPPILIPSAENEAVYRAITFKECDGGRHDSLKDQYSLRTYPGTERSSLFTAGMHDHGSASSKALLLSLIRDHPDMFPLHDVLEPAIIFTNAHCVTNDESETYFVWTNSLDAEGIASATARRELFRE